MMGADRVRREVRVEVCILVLGGKEIWLDRLSAAPGSCTDNSFCLA